MYTLLHAVIGYFFLTLMIRTLARRPGAQMTPFEFVLVFLVGGVIILATVGDDHSMTNCYGGVIAICLMHRLVGILKHRSPRWANIIDGTPIVLLQNDEWQMSSMKRAHVDDIDVMAAAREKNVKSLDQIKYAVLERNGSISIIKKIH
ncbi:MAG TPA: YetF domain-containing protein [Chthoniobacterales bacterium]|jgi:uncharacterized membrane protein YcaP (DUF421 family)|nr:YetF domain-containing protein [Chthoniobacterales bacterium]